MSDEFVFLMESRDYFEIEIIKEILEEENIPILIKEPGANHYLKVVMGDFAQTLRKLYVNGEDYEKAKDIIDHMEIVYEDEILQEEIFEDKIE